MTGHPTPRAVPRKGSLGLSAKLLWLTIAFVMLAEVLIFVPSVANFRKNWLMERLAAAQIASLAVEAAPTNQVPERLLLRKASGSVGLGNPFAFPFVTIESIAVLSPTRIAVVNDNNYPFSVGRYAQAGEPDESELILIDLPSALPGWPAQPSSP